MQPPETCVIPLLNGSKKEMRCWRSRDEFRERVQEWALKLDVKAHSTYIRPMSRKWASCSSAGTLSFNDELLRLPRELGDYVIVHELLHFSVPNHGKLWKSLMRAYLGEYEELEMKLREIVTQQLAKQPPGSGRAEGDS